MQSAVSICVCLVAMGSVVLAAADEMEKKPPVVTEVIEGSYEVRRGGTSIGQERFAEKVMSDNTDVLEVIYRVETEVELSGTSRFVWEDDSRFPIRYDAKRISAQSNVQDTTEVSAEMFANVLVLHGKRNDKAFEQNYVLPTGCLLMERDLASHLRVLFARYDARKGGTQSFVAFDPLAGREMKLTLDFVEEGDYPKAEGIVGSGVVSRFRYTADDLPPWDLAVDQKGRVVWANDPTNNVEFVLRSLTRKKP